MNRLVVALLAAGCGRVEFTPIPTSDGVVGPPIDCPADYVAVFGNAALGTPAFCVMAVEARQVLGEARTPPGMLPWVDVTATAAAAACAALGPSYALLANREWMTIARDAELVAANWSSGTPGTGRIVEGNTDDTSATAISDPGDPYSDTGNSATDPPGAGWEQRRTLVLSTGAVVWDLPGNNQEWIDWTLGAPLDGAPPCSGGELPVLACAGYAPEDFQSSTGTYDSTVGVGRVLGGAGDAARRGGQSSDRDQGIAGIYALNMNRFVDQTFPATGFRCAFHP